MRYISGYTLSFNVNIGHYHTVGALTCIMFHFIFFGSNFCSSLLIRGTYCNFQAVFAWVYAYLCECKFLFVFCYGCGETVCTTEKVEVFVKKECLVI